MQRPPMLMDWKNENGKNDPTQKNRAKSHIQIG